MNDLSLLVAVDVAAWTAPAGAAWWRAATNDPGRGVQERYG